jgi:hypothetical protein
VEKPETRRWSLVVGRWLELLELDCFINFFRCYAILCTGEDDRASKIDLLPGTYDEGPTTGSIFRPQKSSLTNNVPQNRGLESQSASPLLVSSRLVLMRKRLHHRLTRKTRLLSPPGY